VDQPRAQAGGAQLGPRLRGPDLLEGDGVELEGRQARADGAQARAEVAGEAEGQAPDVERGESQAQRASPRERGSLRLRV
jgi:hypothetical protein